MKTTNSRNNLFHVGMIGAMLAFGLLVSCTTTSGYKPISELRNVEVIGSVSAEFFAKGGNGYVAVTRGIKQQAYIELKKIALEKYQGDIDVRDISVSLIKWRGVFVFSGGDYFAEGKVVLLNSRNSAKADTDSPSESTTNGNSGTSGSTNSGGRSKVID